MPTLWFSRWFEHSWLKRDHFRPPTDRSGISVYIQALTKQLSLDVNDYGVKINSNWSDYSFRFLIPVNYELTPVQISDKDFLRSRNYTELINVEFIKLKAIIRSDKFSVLLSVTGIIRGPFDRQRLIRKMVKVSTWLNFLNDYESSVEWKNEMTDLE